MLKKLLILIVILIVVAVAAVGGLVFYIDSAAKVAVEQGATYALGVETTLASADVGLTSGTFDMQTLAIANPEGFDDPSFMEMADGGVAVTLGSIFTDTVEVQKIELTGLSLNLQKKDGNSNYGVILANLEKLSSKDPAAQPEPGKGYIVEEIIIRDLSVKTALLPVGGDATRATIRIPEIRMQRMASTDTKPMRIADLTKAIMAAIFGAVVQAGGGVIPADLIGDLGNSLGNLGDVAGFAGQIGGEALKNFEGIAGEAAKHLEGAGDAAKGISEEAGKKLEDVGKGIGDLFGGDDDDK